MIFSFWNYLHSTLIKYKVEPKATENKESLNYLHSTLIKYKAAPIGTSAT